MSDPQRRFKLVLVTLGISGCGLPHSAKEEPKAAWDDVRGRMKLQIARDHLDAGRVSDAEAQLLDALRFKPANAEAQILLARVAIQRGELAAAREALDTAARLDDTSADVPYLLGVIAEWTGDVESAISLYGRAVELSPTSLTFIASQVEVLVAADRADEALTLIRSHQQDFAGNRTLNCLAGDVCTMLGRYDEATESIREAVIAAPDDWQAQLQFGAALVRAGKDREAVDVLKPVIARHKDAPFPPRLALAKAYLRLNATESAVAVLRQATASQSLDAEPWSWLAVAASRTGDLVTARSAADKACRIETDNVEYQLLLCIICLAQGDASAARSAVAAARRIDPDDPAVLKVLQRMSNPNRVLPRTSVNAGSPSAVELSVESPTKQMIAERAIANFDASADLAWESGTDPTMKSDGDSTSGLPPG